jgi:hypothetical protein
MFDLCPYTVVTMMHSMSKWVSIFSYNLHLEMGGILCPFALLSLLNKNIFRGREVVVGHFKFAFS